MGAEFFDFIKSNSIISLTFIDKNFMDKKLSGVFLDEFFHGINLKSYEFKKYKSEKKLKEIRFNILSTNKKFKLDSKNIEFH